MIALQEGSGQRLLYPAFDGNGNVVSLVDAQDGSAQIAILNGRTYDVSGQFSLAGGGSWADFNGGQLGFGHDGNMYAVDGSANRTNEVLLSGRSTGQEQRINSTAQDKSRQLAENNGMAQREFQPNTQEFLRSCGPAAVRNLVEYQTGRKVAESEVREQFEKVIRARDWSSHGLSASEIRNAIPQVLSQYGLKGTPHLILSQDDLLQAISVGEPFIMASMNPGGTQGHIVMGNPHSSSNGANMVRIFDSDRSFGPQVRVENIESFHHRVIYIITSSSASK